MRRQCAKIIGILFALLAFALPVNPAVNTLHYKEVMAISMAIESIELEGRKDFFLPPGTDGQLVAKLHPANLDIQVRWEIASRSENLELELNPDTGRLVVAPNSGLGWITVRASAEGCLPLDRRIDIDCECREEYGPCESTVIGGGEANIGSVDVRLSLGKVAGGRSAGDLFLFAEEPLAILSTPEAMVINSSSGQVTPIYRDGLLEQIITPQAIVNFIRYSPLKYEVHFYDFRFRGKKLEDGAYSLGPAAVSLAVWRIENPDETGETIDQLSVTEIRDGKEREFFYTYEASENNWSLVSGNGLKIESKSETTNEAGDKIVRTTVAGPDGNPVRVEETVYREFAFGEQRVRETIDPEGADLATEYCYQTASGPGYGKLAARIDSDGGWVRYAYDDEGRITREVRPFLDTPIDRPDDKAVVVTKRYAPVDKGDQDAEQDRHRPRLVIKTINGIEAARTYYAYIRDKDGARTEITERCTRQGRPYGHSTNLKTVARYYSRKGEDPQTGKIKSRLSEGGKLSTYHYESGRFQLSPDPAKCLFIPGKGKATRKTVTYGTEKHPEGIPYRTTRETTITDSMGLEKMRETNVRTPEGYARIDWQFKTHNRLGKVIETLHANRTRTESEWGCCGKTSETDSEGITIRYTYDDLKRMTAQTNEATGVVTSYTYDAAGRRLTNTQSNEGLGLTQKSRYDTAGRLTAQVDAAGLMTRYAGDKDRSIVTHPGGATEISTRHLDGKTRSVTGTGVVPRFYDYGVNPDGSQWTTVFIGKEDSPRWEKTTRDLTGRVLRVEKPGFEGVEIAHNVYNAKGQLVRKETPGRAATLYEYDAFGHPTRTGLDVDGDGRLTPVSMDRIALSKVAFKQIDDAWWQESQRSIFATDNSPEETIILIQRQRLTGWKNGMTSETVAIDIYGNETRAVETLDRFKRTRTRTTYTPDSNIPLQAVYVDGRLAATTSKTGITMRYGYDALGRRIAVEDPRKGISTIHYDRSGRLEYVQDPAGNRARFEYDPESGRKIAEINALNKAIRYQYNQRGQLIRTWGDLPYPVEYAYDAFGQMMVMQTFRSGRSWNGDTWPVDTGPGDQTIWHYQPGTGLLLAKEDAKGHRTSYTYGSGGSLKTRTWARLKNGKPLRTTYQYEKMTNELKKIDYSDDTPDIAFAYGRLGRMVRVSDAAGVHSFSYDSKLRLVSEGLTGHQIYQINLNYDDLGRATGFTLDDGYEVSYGYDDIGRFKTVDWQLGDQVGGVAYQYLENSDRLSGMESKSGLSVHYDYEPHRDVKTAVENTFMDRLISKYEYQYDRLGRRINVKNSGEAFDKDGFWLYGYNDRNEIATASRFVGDDLKDQSQPISDFERVYRFDPIGNRVEAVEGKDKIQYQTNSLNQYERIVAPPQEEKALIYDEDGNLIEDGRFRYSWNAENRLVAVDPKVAVTGAKRLEFAYDYLGRRIRKKAFQYAKKVFKLSSEACFVYDGRNMVKEINAENQATVSRSYVWGLDLSQSREGAGGVGGLLATSDGLLTHSYVFDANGNVGQLVNVYAGIVTAHYEYDPFGKFVCSINRLGIDNPHQFSTKHIDRETDLYYYGYRYYHPDLGRWIKKDPLSENGGFNLYGFISNSTTQYIDKYGFQKQSADSIGADDTTFSSGVNPLDILRVLYSIPFDIASGDIFREEIEDNYNDTQCEYLITITGIFTDKDGNSDFNRFIRELPQYNDIPNATLVYNPTRFIILDLIQILGNEIGTIDTVARRAAEKITNAALKAIDNNCSNCYTIYVVAHSQGTMVFKEALYLLPEEVKNRIEFVGLGGQVAIDGSSVLISARNIAAKEDLVPWANKLPTRIIDGFGGKIEIFESGQDPLSAHDSGKYIEYLRKNP
ncbi:MAG: RHS repeat protein [Desulfobacteraceae bacterium]|nr:RHS repeat protein [Desulfobacteraceae bacterium]MBC2751453.1 RHS repeat protein [Desulfobacteraceae bacterium]